MPVKKSPAAGAGSPVVAQALGEQRAPSAKSHLTTILGEFVRPHGGGLWTATAVAALGTLGVTERNARQALARLGESGLIEPERHGRSVRWWLTADGTRLLTTGAERIYAFGARGEQWDGHWLVVLCSVPESQRTVRHRLRTLLAFEGFGFVAPSVAVCPHRDRQGPAMAILAELGLTGEALTLEARTGEFTSDVRMIELAWELGPLERQYRRFLDEFWQVRPDTAAAAFRDTIRLVGAWRHFPFQDPELPAELLPPHWPGRSARDLFTDRRTAWSAAAREWWLAAEGEHSTRA